MECFSSCRPSAFPFCKPSSIPFFMPFSVSGNRSLFMILKSMIVCSRQEMGNIPSLPFKRYIILKFPCGDRFFKYTAMVEHAGVLILN